MHTWIPFFKKEWRRYRRIFFSFFAAMAAFGFVGLIKSGTMAATAMMMAVPLYVAVAVLPWLFSHSLSRDWQTHHQYLLMSLPVPKIRVFLCKYLVFLAFILVMFALYSTIVLVLPVGEATRASGMGWSAKMTIWWLFSGYTPSFAFALLGVAGVFHGVHLACRHWAVKLSKPIGFVGLAVFVALTVPVVALSDEFWLFELRAESNAIEITDYYFHLGFWIYGWLFGLATIWVATRMYRKFADI
ncbi:ABC-2 transporter permease [Sulfidibacter corallicola]|uniref:ABC-2 transporter permease n=1 Tax=Sulfidibacter corallicola TaxID=2818388 RepID=A0A8A4TFT1_SULCO|nr:hypothetical protein [Sulfidibacter corallicola]QTD48796.1 ABC-2 transporter permease [Sulfidibacter corallicola]